MNKELKSWEKGFKSSTVKEMADESSRPAMIAKKDFVIHFNEIHIEIKAGDDVSHVPEMFLENLKTEQVI